MSSLTKKIQRKKDKDAKKEMQKKVGLFNKLSDHCLVCQKDFDKKNDIKMVGGDLMKYTSKCIIKLELTTTGRYLNLVKHRSIPIKRVRFEITSENIIEASGPKKYSLF